MNIAGYKTFTISKHKLNPASILYGRLRGLGISDGQVKGIMFGRKVIELMNLYEEVMKSSAENKAKVFIEWSEVMPKIRKPRQLRFKALK